MRDDDDEDSAIMRDEEFTSLSVTEPPSDEASGASESASPSKSSMKADLLNSNRKKLHDLPFAIACVINFFVTSSYSLGIGSLPLSSQSSNSDLFTLLLAIGVGAALAFGWILLMFGTRDDLRNRILFYLIPVSSIILLLAALLLFTLYPGSWLISRSIGVTLIAVAVFDFLWRGKATEKFDSIPMLLEVCHNVLTPLPFLYKLGYGSILLQSLWSLLVSMAVHNIVHRVFWTNEVISMIYVLVSMAWMSNVIGGTFSVTITSVAYSQLHNRTTSDSDIMPLTQNIITKSIGSISMGALLGRPIQLLNYFRVKVTALKYKGVTIPAAQTVGSFMEPIIRRFNRFGLFHLASQDIPYATAAEQIWNIFIAGNIEAILQDDCASKLSSVAGYGSGGVAAVVGAMISIFAFTSHSIVIYLVAAHSAWAAVSVATQLLDANVAALLLVHAETPDILNERYPLIYHRFVRVSQMNRFDGLETMRS